MIGDLWKHLHLDDATFSMHPQRGLDLRSVWVSAQNCMAFRYKRICSGRMYASAHAASTDTVRKQFLIALAAVRSIGVNRRCIHIGMGDWCL
jgi:hypothetical protein